MRAAATASMVSGARRNRTERKAINQAMDSQSQAMQEPAQAEPVQATAPAPATDDTTAQLQELAKLKDQGILTEEEFAAKKKQLLGI